MDTPIHNYDTYTDRYIQIELALLVFTPVHTVRQMEGIETRTCRQMEGMAN